MEEETSRITGDKPTLLERESIESVCVFMNFDTDLP